jgi:hypothetical protein
MPGSTHQSSSAKSPDADIKHDSQLKGAAMSASAMHNQPSATDREAAKLKSQETPTQHGDKTKLRSSSSSSSDRDMSASSATRPVGSSGSVSGTEHTANPSARHQESTPAMSPNEHSQAQQPMGAHQQGSGHAGGGMSRTTSDTTGKDHDQQHQQSSQHQKQHQQHQQDAKPMSSEHDSSTHQREKKSGIEYR